METLPFPLLLIVSALIDSVNPCAISVLLITIAFLLSLGKPRKEILAIGGAYIGGIIIVYTLIGLGILATLTLFGIPHGVAKIGATVMIIFGLLDLAGELIPGFPIQLKIPSMAHGKIALLMEKASIPAAALLGVFVGSVEFPCTGGPYLTVLGLLHDNATKLQGFLYLLLYNVIFVSPLIFLLYLANTRVMLEKIDLWRKTYGHTHLIMGCAMILLGVVILAL
jgi:cytochrome c biogenesis protein CcdA